MSSLLFCGLVAASTSVAHLSWVWFTKRDIWGQPVTDRSHGMAMIGGGMLLVVWLSYCLVYLAHTHDTFAGLMVPFVPIFGFFILGIGYVLGGFVGGIICGLREKD